MSSPDPANPADQKPVQSELEQQERRSQAATGIVAAASVKRAQSEGTAVEAAVADQQPGLNCGEAQRGGGGEDECEKPIEAMTTFMEHVMAWPGADGAGWVNLHWKPTKPTSPHDFRGKPFKELHDFMAFAQYAATKPGTYAEIYYCMATQATT